MSLEDPYLIVHNEVIDALAKLRNNFTTWEHYQEESIEISKEDYAAFVIELKNGLKSIQWDMDELEESLENNEKGAKLDPKEIERRKKFIIDTRQEVMEMSDKLQKAGSKLKSKTDFSINFGSQNLTNNTKYSRLVNDPEVANSSDVHQQPKMTYDEDEHKSPYNADQSIMFDEADHTVHVISSHHNRMDRVKELLYLTTKQRQLWAGAVGVAMFVLLIILAL